MHVVNSLHLGIQVCKKIKESGRGWGKRKMKRRQGLECPGEHEQ